jgi:histidinol phosphatase-like enzyme (inositol monophosphatase family)
VTAADRAIERALRERINAAFPTHGVFGEEEGPDRPDAEFLWVLDPIDGTKAFASKNPLFGTLIGLMHRGVPVVGVLDAAALGERWSAARGLGAVHEGRPIHARPARPLADAVLYCTTPDPLAENEGFQRLRQQVQWTSYGGDCIAYALVAMGGADLVIDRGLEPYDWCALVPIVTEAGGVLCDWNGRSLTLASDGDVIVASCRTLADVASKALAP